MDTTLREPSTLGASAARSEQPDAAGIEAEVASVGQDRIHGPAGHEGHGVSGPQHDGVVPEGREVVSRLAGHEQGRDGSPKDEVEAKMEASTESGGLAGHALQVMSAPQQRGDLILPSQDGQRET